MSATTWLYGAAALVALGATLYVLVRPRAAGQAAGAAVAGAAVGVATGAVEGVGQALGVPLTDAAKCQACIAARDWWSASVYCPAGTFLGALLGGGSPANERSASSTPSARTNTPGAPATSAQPGAGVGPAPELGDDGSEVTGLIFGGGA